MRRFIDQAVLWPFLRQLCDNALTAPVAESN